MGGVRPGITRVLFPAPSADCGALLPVLERPATGMGLEQRPRSVLAGPLRKRQPARSGALSHSRATRVPNRASHRPKRRLTPDPGPPRWRLPARPPGVRVRPRAADWPGLKARFLRAASWLGCAAMTGNVTLPVPMPAHLAHSPSARIGDGSSASKSVLYFSGTSAELRGNRVAAA